ncbi:DsbA family oxidoreductase [Streptomyces malaysiensis]|uniref:DsbA family oxidoreductase n=1 Tax=Streptomyces malaysiensis TaxID=92644 RepID=UPI001E3FB3E2|nr:MULTISPECIES: DsbA family protein [unclassified Streptomyces]
MTYLQAMQAELFSATRTPSSTPPWSGSGSRWASPEQIREVPAGGQYADRVRADQGQAARLAARGVPFIVIDGRYAVPGAQDSDTLLDLLRTAWADTHPVVPVAGDAPVCGPNGCAFPERA